MLMSMPDEVNWSGHRITSTNQHPKKAWAIRMEYSTRSFSTDLLLAAAFLPCHFKPGATSSLRAHPTRVPCAVP